VVEVVAQDGGRLVEEAGDLGVGPALEELLEELCVVAAARGDELLLDGGTLWEKGKSVSGGRFGSKYVRVRLVARALWELGRWGELTSCSSPPMLARLWWFVRRVGTRCWREWIGEVKLYTNSCDSFGGFSCCGSARERV
jgi:hypothetical protein